MMFDHSMSDIDPDENYFDGILSNACQYYSPTDYKTLSSNLNCDLIIFNYNVRSFNANKESFFALLDCMTDYPDVLVLTETWFSPESEVNITGYNAFHTTRSDRVGGGVSIFIKSKWNAELVPNCCICNDVIEIFSIQVKIQKSACIYIWYL